jgi:hypothetical protein
MTLRENITKTMQMQSKFASILEFTVSKDFAVS